MPYQKHHTTREDLSQGSGSQDDWTKEVLPRLPATLEEQAMHLKAFERSRKIGSATDLLRLSVALRILTLLEFVVCRSLKQQAATLVGLYKDNPRKATATPTAERLLQAFVPITLTQVHLPEHIVCHLTPLTPVQQQILALLGFPSDLYTSLARTIPQTAFPLRE